MNTKEDWSLRLQPGGGVLSVLNTGGSRKFVLVDSKVSATIIATCNDGCKQCPMGGIAVSEEKLAEVKAQHGEDKFLGAIQHVGQGALIPANSVYLVKDSSNDNQSILAPWARSSELRSDSFECLCGGCSQVDSTQVKLVCDVIKDGFSQVSLQNLRTQQDLARLRKELQAQTQETGKLRSDVSSIRSDVANIQRNLTEFLNCFMAPDATVSEQQSSQQQQAPEQPQQSQQPRQPQQSQQPKQPQLPQQLSSQQRPRRRPQQLLDQQQICVRQEDLQHDDRLQSTEHYPLPPPPHQHGQPHMHPQQLRYMSPQQKQNDSTLSSQQQQPSHFFPQQRELQHQQQRPQAKIVRGVLAPSLRSKSHCVACSAMQYGRPDHEYNNQDGIGDSKAVMDGLLSHEKSSFKQNYNKRRSIRTSNIIGGKHVCDLCLQANVWNLKTSALNQQPPEGCTSWFEYYNYRWSAYIVQMQESRARGSNRKQKREEDNEDDYSADEE